MGFLRFILSLSVLVAHTEPFFGIKFLGGMGSVQLFFIISGFYMTMVLNKKYVGKGSYWLFISNRFLRLYPSYFIVLLVTILVSLIFLSGEDSVIHQWLENINSLNEKNIIILSFVNIVIFGQDLIMFLGLDQISNSLYFTSNFRESNIFVYKFLFLPQAWSISIELMFYIVAPFIVRRKLKYIVLLILLSILLRAYIYFYLNLAFDPWSYRFFPTELALFLFGSLAYKFYETIDHNKKLATSHYLVILIYFILIFSHKQILDSSIILSQLKLWGIYILSIFVIPYLFFITKNNRIDKFIGELSYPIYLIHMLVIAILSRFSFESYLSETACIVSVLFSILLIKYIEEPIEVFRQKRVMIDVLR